MSNTQFRLFSIPPLPFHALARAESWTGRLMAVYGRSDEMREQHQRCDVKSCLLLNLSADFTSAFDYYNGLQARPIVRLLEPFGIVDHRGHFGFDAVAIGSPHLSEAEIDALVGGLAGRRVAIPFYACTGRHVLDRLGDGRRLQA